MRTLNTLREALEGMGVLFLPSIDASRGPGMRLRDPGDLASALVIRAAAAARHLSTERLAEISGVSERTVVRLRAEGVSDRLTLERLRTALERKGVTFLEAEGSEGPGFRLPLSLVKRQDLRF